MKAVLVIEMPKVCGECRASFCGDVWYCYGGEYRRPLFTENIQEKPSWCPLKPMPKEEDIYEVGMDEEDTNAKRQWNKGWNACLDAITGETE